MFVELLAIALVPIIGIVFVIDFARKQYRDYKRDKKMNVITQFSGFGGLDLGSEKVGFIIPVANEFDKGVWETFKVNHPNS